MANLVFIPNQKASSGSQGLSLEDIPEDIRKDVEEVYTTLKSNPGRMRVEFASLAEMNLYISQVQAYCALRPGGAIKFRKSPTRNLPPTTMDFRITDLLTPAEAEAEGIRNAAEAAKAAAATTGTAKK